MDLWKSANGMARVQLICADPAAAISQIIAAGIAVYGADREDGDIIVRFSVRRQDVKKLRALADRRGYELTVSRKLGIYWIGKRLLRRPVLAEADRRPVLGVTALRPEEEPLWLLRLS